MQNQTTTKREQAGTRRAQHGAINARRPDLCGVTREPLLLLAPLDDLPDLEAEEDEGEHEEEDKDQEGHGDRRTQKGAAGGRGGQTGSGRGLGAVEEG